VRLGKIYRKPPWAKNTRFKRLDFFVKRYTRDSFFFSFCLFMAFYDFLPQFMTFYGLECLSLESRPLFHLHSSYYGYDDCQSFFLCTLSRQFKTPVLFSAMRFIFKLTWELLRS
jgi:hypothetical protein